MAQVTLSSGSIARPHKCPWGAFPIRHMTAVSTNAKIQLGRLVTLNQSNDTSFGQITVGGVGSSVFYIVGLAASSLASSGGGSSAVANLPIPVWEANPAVEFVANTKGGPVVSSLVGLRKSLNYDSTLEIQYVEVGASTAADWRVIITGVPGENGISGLQGNLGDSGAQVTFRFFTDPKQNQGSSVALASTTPLLAFFG